MSSEQPPGRTFRALVLRDGPAREATLERVPVDELPDHEILVRVSRSSLNYKDALAVTGTGKIARRFPMVPGIDLAGTVVEPAPSAATFADGDRVLVTGCGIGEEHWGGFAELARLDPGWLTRVPDELGLDGSMAIGTAGFTAMLAVMALEEHGLAAGGSVVVTGAGGGVGGLAIAILAHLGHRVTAVTGRRAELSDYLEQLGASEILDRERLAREPKPLESERWDGAVDAVGGTTLASIISQLRHGAAVAACGLAGGPALATTVFPFILRGVALLGVNSVHCPPDRRQRAWDRLVRDLPRDRLGPMTRHIPLADVPEASRSLLRGEIRGRLVVDVGDAG